MKPADQYARNGVNKDGSLRLRFICKDCTSVYNREQYQLNRETRIGYQQRYYEKNKEAARAKARERYRRDPEKSRRDVYRSALKNRYNMTPEQWQALLDSQGGKCAICGTSEVGHGAQGWHVDHDHACCPGERSCGKCVRGILCAPCNHGLGRFRDRPELLLLAHAYVTYHV